MNVRKNILQKLRTWKLLRQIDISKILNIHPNTYRLIEKNIRQLSRYQERKLCKLFGFYNEEGKVEEKHINRLYE